MESDDDFDLFSVTEEAASSAAHEGKLKRLIKKAKTIQVDSPNYDTDKSVEEPNWGSRSKLVEDIEPESGFGNLGAKRVLEFDSLEINGVETENREMQEEIKDLGSEKSERKRRSFDKDEEIKEKKKKKKKNEKDNGVDSDCKTHKSTVCNKRRGAKERKNQLMQLHVESQRLLRETGHATFKPLPLVQKPISSILEKIRQRKQEIFRKSVSLSIASSINDDEFYMDLEPRNAPIEEMEDFTAAKAVSDETIAHPTDVENNIDVSCADVSTETKTQSSHESIPSLMDLNPISKQAFRAPVDDTQTSYSKDSFPDDTPSSPLEEVLAPSLLALNLKLDSAPPEDISSDEENNDKENMDPHLHRSVDLSSSPNGDPVKAFVDDEAAEEDDSDNDLFRFQDKDEDEDDEDDEECNNMIATGFEEKPTDVEKRNELHQKWLEQQDDDGTEKLLQRLKCGLKQTGTALIDEKDGEGKEENEESDDEAAQDLVTANVVRTNLRKAKQMISQMFTDLNDAYVSSDDEETETRQVKQCLSEKAHVQSKHLSIAKDEQSSNVLIKKINVAPDPKKKAKASSFLNMSLIVGNKHASSKSSFLGRGLHHSLPSSHKHGSSKGRSFIFERDDSRSRSEIPEAEDSLNMMQREKQSTRTASAKFSSNSQVKSTTEDTKSTAEMNSGTSLHEILRRSSRQSIHCTQDSVICHNESVFAAFKLEKKPIKKEPGIPIRTG
ncbi:hypothetical protein CFOL_v3_13778 [Cephalotus follicularis]|uniref:Uncharacterized protein n=1 Tax=Cephalotus follicularis TaxID=3775 RepID=A0A1Q3BQJ7_CEPFO|nr:hypothetical protein CFOL_v3_13778 [Cephalotus follicularis]